MIPFHALIEWLFSWFKINHDSSVLKDAVSSDDEKVFVIKKSRYFITLFSGGRLLGILVIWLTNIALLIVGKAFPLERTGAIVLWLSINLILWFWSILEYLSIYDKNYGIFTIMPARDRYPILQRGDRQFARFFNQTIALIIFYFIVMAIFIWWAIFFWSAVTETEAVLLGVNGVLLIFQYLQIQRTLWRFVNLEMDFTIVTDNKVKHTNQVGISFESKSIDLDKLKNIAVNKQWRLRSVFDYGEVWLLTEGDAAWHPDLVLPYIKRPETVEALIYKIKINDVDDNIDENIDNNNTANKTATETIHEAKHTYRENDPEEKDSHSDHTTTSPEAKEKKQTQSQKHKQLIEHLIIHQYILVCQTSQHHRQGLHDQILYHTAQYPLSYTN